MFDLQQTEELCRHFGFDDFPRAIGNPRQHFVFASEQAYSSYREWDGINPCFISTAAYDNLQFELGRQVPKSIIHSLTFFDFDHETKPENAFADAQRLSAFLTDMDVAHWVQYSGSKGYHLFIMHEPTRFKFDFRDGSSEALKSILNQTQTFLKNLLGLNTLDEQTTGDPKRLCRFPYTKHVNRHGNASGRYAIPVPTKLLEKISHEEIENRAYSPRYLLPKITGRKISLRDFIDEIGVMLQNPEDMVRPIVNVDFDFSDSDAETNRFLAALNHRCMGVVNELKRKNPGHKSRVHAAMMAKVLGIQIDAFEAIWMQMGNRIGYVDLHNHEYRREQMESLFLDPRYHSFANCSTLKKDGCCVGDICPRFKELQGDLHTPSRRVRKWSKPDDTSSPNHPLQESR